MATITGAGFHLVSDSGGTSWGVTPAGAGTTSSVFVNGTGGGTVAVGTGAGNVNINVFGSGNETLDNSAGQGTDKLSAGNGDDTLIATTSGGTDTLSGSGGADTFEFNVGAGTHTVTDFVASQDTIQLASGLLSASGFPGDLTGFLNANTTTVGSNSLISLGAGDTLQVNGIDKAGVLNAATAGHITVV